MSFKLIFALVLFLLSQCALRACTIISCSMNGKAFAAGNEDEYLPFTRLWFNPAADGRYGSVCFGGPDMQIAAAMNQHGLFYDYTAQNPIDISNKVFKNPHSGDLFFEILGRCKTVDEALAYLKLHDYTTPTSQVLLADAMGNSVIINAAGIVHKTGNYQINTNFNICDLATGYKCERYDTANAMLKQADDVSVPVMASVLNAVHQEGKLSTIYSNVYNLKEQKIHVYLFHDFGTSYEIDLKKELAKGYHIEMLADHFTGTVASRAFAETNSLYKKESIMREIRLNGTAALSRYDPVLSGETNDKATKDALLNTAVQLIRDSHNEHRNGSSWDYWFALGNGYDIKHSDDIRLDAAAMLLHKLSANEADKKLVNFMLELQGYICLVQNKPYIALGYYRAAADDLNFYPISSTRAKEMLKRIAI